MQRLKCVFGHRLTHEFTLPQSCCDLNPHLWMLSAHVIDDAMQILRNVFAHPKKQRHDMNITHPFLGQIVRRLSNRRRHQRKEGQLHQRVLPTLRQQRLYAHSNIIKRRAPSTLAGAVGKQNNGLRKWRREMIDIHDARTR